MPDFCQQALTKNDIHDLRTQTSHSRLFAEEAKQWTETDKHDHNLLTLEPIDSLQSVNHYNIQYIPEISDERIYSLESSDSENDAVLSNDVILQKISNDHDAVLSKNKVKHSRNGTFIEIIESYTTSADHKLVEAVIIDNTKKEKKKEKKKYYSKKENTL